MSVAEIKEEIVKHVIMSDDSVFLNDIAAFIATRHHHSVSMPSPDTDLDAFWTRLTGEYGDVLAKLAQ